MATALDFTLPAPRVHAAFDSIDLALQTRAQTGSGANGGPFVLDVANALWAQSGLTLEQPFLDTLATDYGAGVRLEPFATAPDSARTDINAWVDGKTDGLIPQLLGPGSITNDTLFVITNAVYFSGAWQTPFEKSATHSATFNNADGTTATVQMMSGSYSGAGFVGSGFTAVEIPYSNPDLTLTLIVPDAGQLSTIEAQLSESFFANITHSEMNAEVALSLPRFTATTQASLKAPLSSLGMGAAFSAGADFSGIDGAHDIIIGDVIHQATITVDEDGTQAAAATGVVGVGTALLPSIALVVDRPFILVLRDLPTGTILFLGRIAAGN
jgi:serpin B